MAPEIHLGREYDGIKVDLFASGIVLFTIMTQRPPFRCAIPDDAHYNLLASNDCDRFWRAHNEVEDCDDAFSPEFKDLFVKLISLSPGKRPTIEQIYAHPWMQGPTSSEAEIVADFTERKRVIDAESKRERAEKRQQRNGAEESRRVMRSGAQNGAAADDGEENLRDTWASLDLNEYGPVYQQCNTQFFMSEQPLDFFEELVNNYLEKKEVEYRISGYSLKVKYVTRLDEKDVRVIIQVLSVNETKWCVKFTYRDVTTKQDIRGNSPILHFMSVRDDAHLRMFNDTTYDE